MILGSVDEYSNQVALMAKAVGCCIVSVNYRLAPEFPYPTPLEDCYTSLKWVFDNSKNLLIDPKKVAVGGLSAGANLAAGLSLLARDRAEYSLCFQLLICPMLDPIGNHASYQRAFDKRVWHREINREAWDAYLNGLDPISEYAAPILSRNLKYLPSAYISVGDQDIFVDENVRFAQKLLEADISVDLHIISGAFHGFEFAVPEASVSINAWKSHYEALRRAFGIGVSDGG